MNAPTPTIRRCSGAAIEPHLDDIARLRIAVFRQWPYLYDGDAAYEAEYLKTYVASPRSLLVLAVDGDAVVGASTGLPMADESQAFREPLERAGHDVDSVFYCGESVLLPQYRGLGLGHRFFDEREAHARSLGFVWSAFCAVDRSDKDPRCPPGHRGNEAFWRKRGYRQAANLRASMPWNEVGDGEVMHTLSFWLRPLEDAR